LPNDLITVDDRAFVEGGAALASHSFAAFRSPVVKRFSNSVSLDARIHLLFLIRRAL
jgi:hypothetical protein